MPVLLRILGIAAGVLAMLFIAVEASPWPSALLIRYAFETDARRVDQALAGQVPGGVTTLLNQHYDAADPDARLDVFFPAAAEAQGTPLLTVVWIHGGGWLSGSKDYIANYARILAADGYTVVGVDYSIAPGKTYPTPLRQLTAALSYLKQHAARLHVDPQRFVLAGDSAGAQIAAQLANAVTSADYARELALIPALKPSQLLGVLLYCGPYDLRPAKGSLVGAWFSRTALWSYGGTRNLADPRLAPLSVLNYVTARFPASFISAGNADPLVGQSQALARRLSALGVKVETLFFPDDYQPEQPHEYQFNLGSAEGQRALKASLQFLLTLGEGEARTRVATPDPEP